MGFIPGLLTLGVESRLSETMFLLDCRPSRTLLLPATVTRALCKEDGSWHHSLESEVLSRQQLQQLSVAVSRR